MSAVTYPTFSPPDAVYEATLPGASLLKLKARNLQGLEEELERGLPVKTLDTLVEKLGIDLETLASLLGTGFSTLKAHKRSRSRLSPEQSAKAYRLARIFERASEVIGSEDEARGWLGDSVLALGKRTPLQAMTTDLGGERVLHLLERLDDGVFS
jgi:putative toxin-antitoxin system antitoxin component (TIGR02293 family)